MEMDEKKNKKENNNTDENKCSAARGAQGRTAGGMIRLYEAVNTQSSVSQAPHPTRARTHPLTHTFINWVSRGESGAEHGGICVIKQTPSDLSSRGPSEDEGKAIWRRHE